MMAKKNKRMGKGEQLISNLKSSQKLAAINLAGEVVTQLDEILKKFSTGTIGGKINDNAPGVLLNPEAKLLVPPHLSPSQLANTRSALVNVLLDNDFQNALDKFQQNLASVDLDHQIILLRQFSAIDWAAIAKGVPEDSPALAKVQLWIYNG